MRLFRIILFFAVVLMLGVAAIAFMPDPEPQEAGIHIVFEPFGGPAGLDVPEGWEAADPFGSATPYYGLLWYHQMPPMGSRVALVKRADDPMELLLMVAPKESVAKALEREAKRFSGHPQVELAPSLTMKTATGDSVHFRVARVKNPVHPEGDTTYVLGSADVGDGLALVINGGGITEVFDLDEVEEIVTGLRVPSEPLARR